MIAIVNYGVSNIGSMLNMMKKIGVTAQPVSNPDEIEHAEKIVLPGVGAFDHGMSALHALNLVETIKRRVVQDRVPILGVCLGMQLLSQGSEEGKAPGLSFVKGSCVRFRSNKESEIKVPHMGWNELSLRRQNALMEGLEGSRFYFVHSYHLVCDDVTDVLASSHYGIDFTAVVQHGNVWGVQFHPEKSHHFGMALLTNFARL
jgi:imidazole glycerol-phosphate synthase subunit HisH